MINGDVIMMFVVDVSYRALRETFAGVILGPVVPAVRMIVSFSVHMYPTLVTAQRMIPLVGMLKDTSHTQKRNQQQYS